MTSNTVRFVKWLVRTPRFVRTFPVSHCSGRQESVESARKKFDVNLQFVTAVGQEHKKSHIQHLPLPSRRFNLSLLPTAPAWPRHIGCPSQRSRLSQPPTHHSYPSQPPISHPSQPPTHRSHPSQPPITAVKFGAQSAANYQLLLPFPLLRLRLSLRLSGNLHPPQYLHTIASPTQIPSFTLSLPLTALLSQPSTSNGPRSSAGPATPACRDLVCLVDPCFL